MTDLLVESLNRGNDDSKSFWFLGTQMITRASGAQTQGVAGVIEQVAPAGFAAPPHIHRAEDEAFYVLEGEITFHRGEETVPASQGSFVWLPRGLAHWFEVRETGAARLLQLNVPAGLETFFEELGTRSAVAPQEPPDFEKLRAIASRYQIEILAGGPQN